MSTLKNLTNFCCRRRILTNRMCPAVLQLLLVLLIWWILKLQTPTATGNTDTVDKKRSIHADQSNCPPAELSNAKVLSYLNLGSLLSRSKNVEPGSDGDLIHYLGVDVYVLDPEKGSFLLYPRDTPINLNHAKTGGQVEGTNDEAYEYSDDKKASEDYMTNNYDTYDGSLAKDKFGDSGFMADSGKGLLRNKSGSIQQVIESNNQQVLDKSHESNNPQVNDVAGRQNTIDEPLLQNTIIGQRSEELGQQFGRDRVSPDIVHGFVSQESQHPNVNLDQKMQTFRQETEAQKINTNSRNISSNSTRILKVPNQDPNLQRGLGTFQQAQGFGQQLESLPTNLQSSDHQSLPTNLQSSDHQSFPTNLQSSDHQSLPTNLQSSDHRFDYPIPDVQQSIPSDMNINLPKYNNVIPNSGNINPLMTQGFLDRSTQFIFELHGNMADNDSDNFTSILLLNSPQACHDSNEVDVVYLINSKPQSSDMRQRIRDTFVKSTYFQPSVIAHVFLVGKTTSPNFQHSLNQEHELYGDIVQGSFMDVQKNATHKGLMGMRWVTQFCPRANYIMTINEDVFVDTEKLIRGLIPATKKTGSQKLMMCFFNPESPIPRSGPNAFNEVLFPGRLNMRPYCKGFAVLMTRGVIPSLLAASQHVKPIQMDELYLYGVLPFIAGGVDVFDVGNKRAFHNFGMEVVNCYQQKMDTCPFVASVAFSERFKTLWDLVKTRMEASHPGWEEERSLWDIQSYIRKF